MTDIQIGFFAGVCCSGITFYFIFVLPIREMLKWQRDKIESLTDETDRLRDKFYEAMGLDGPPKFEPMKLPGSIAVCKDKDDEGANN